MTYKLIITEKAEGLLDNLVCYLLYNLKNKSAAKHLLDEVEMVYKRLEEKPYQFTECKDEYLSFVGYREAHLYSMKYTIVFYVEDSEVHVSGIYHNLELYSGKIRKS